MVSRCFPGGYNVKLYISRGRLVRWLLAFLHSVSSPLLQLHMIAYHRSLYPFMYFTTIVFTFIDYLPETKLLFLLEYQASLRNRTDKDQLNIQKYNVPMQKKLLRIGMLFLFPGFFTKINKAIALILSLCISYLKLKSSCYSILMFLTRQECRCMELMWQTDER